MSARQIAALLKSSRQDGWTNNNNNNNRMYAHQMHHNNNMINTTMYPEQQLSAGLIAQNVQPAQLLLVTELLQNGKQLGLSW